MRAEFIKEYTDSFYSAIHIDLPDIEYEDYDYTEIKKIKKSIDKQKVWEDIKNSGKKIIKKRRPSSHDDLDVYAFPQTWGSTALGHGGIGGAAISSALTVVVGMKRYYYCVYFGGRLAYKVFNPSPNFFEDLHKFNMKRKGEHSQYLNELELMEDESQWIKKCHLKVSNQIWT